jgi:F0F1-type ATP synthase membrane subunit b/b'
MDFRTLAKNLATETAKTVAGKATDVIDSNRDQLVADFEQAVARQRTEFMRDLEQTVARQRVEFVRELAATSARMTRFALITATIIAVPLIVVAFVHLLHR